jgi:hypothetical protein
MLVATFNSTTGWDGKTVAFENGQFALEGHGLITALDVLEYDRKGNLTWAYDGLREWVASCATPTAPSHRGVAMQSTGSPTRPAKVSRRQARKAAKQQAKAARRQAKAAAQPVRADAGKRKHGCAWFLAWLVLGAFALSLTIVVVGYLWPFVVGIGLICVVVWAIGTVQRR